MFEGVCERVGESWVWFRLMFCLVFRLVWRQKWFGVAFEMVYVVLCLQCLLCFVLMCFLSYI